MYFIGTNFSHEKYFLPPFAKINPREKLEIGQFAKLSLYAAEKWKNTHVKFWKNLRFAKLNPREKWVMIKFAKFNPREIKKIREFFSSRKFLPAKICPNKVPVLFWTFEKRSYIFKLKLIYAYKRNGWGYELVQCSFRICSPKCCSQLILAMI